MCFLVILVGFIHIGTATAQPTFNRQTSKGLDTVLAHQLLQRAKKAEAMGQIDSASHLLHLAATEFQQQTSNIAPDDSTTIQALHYRFVHLEMQRSRFFAYLNQVDSGLRHIRQLVTIAQQVLKPNEPLLYRAYINYGNLLSIQYKYAQSLETYLFVLGLYKTNEMNDLNLLANILFSIGHLYVNMDEIENALSYLNQVQLYIEQKKVINDRLAAPIYTALGNIQTHLNADQAKLHFQRAIFYFERQVPVPIDIKSAYIGISNVYALQNDIAQQKAYLEKAEQVLLSKGLNTSPDLLTIYFNLCNVHRINSNKSLFLDYKTRFQVINNRLRLKPNLFVSDFYGMVATCALDNPEWMP